MDHKVVTDKSLRLPDGEYGLLKAINCEIFMIQNVRIAILVLNYNGRHYLAPLFEALSFIKGDPRADVILIDNASHDGSVELCQKDFPWVHCLRNIENYGWGEGYNRGIQLLKQSKQIYSHYLFLNNDTIPRANWFDLLYEAATNSDSKVGEFGCRTVFANDIVQEALFENSSVWDTDQIKMVFLNAGLHSEFFKGKDGYYLQTSPSAKKKGIFKNRLPADTLGYTLQVENNGRRPIQISLRKNLIGKVLGTIKGIALLQVQEGIEGDSIFDIPSKSKILIYRSFADNHEFIPYIQNSGIGLNSSFEGYDLQSYELSNAPQDTQNLAGICGVAKLVRSDIFEQLKGFDPHYFMYYEDLDFSLRLQKAGFKCKMIPDAILPHHHGGSSNVRSKFFARQVAWSLLYFQWRHGGRWCRWKRLISVILRARTEEDNGIYRSQQVNRFALSKFLTHSQETPVLVNRLIQWAGGTIL